MIDLDKDIELYKSKVAFYESQNTRGEYAVTVRELKFVVETLEALRSERSQGDLISREALKKAIEEVEDNYDGYEPNDLGKFMCKVDEIIDNAQTVPLPNEQTAWEQGYEAGLAQGKHDRPQGKLMSLDLAKRVIAKFEGYLDDDMIARIQIALEKESEAENETDN